MSSCQRNLRPSGSREFKRSPNKKMPSQWLAFMLCIVYLTSTGCGSDEQSKSSRMFLGVPEDKTSGEGPVGLINGDSIRVDDVSAVREVPYKEYLEAKQAGNVVAEEEHNGFVYWAVTEDRDIPFEGATAWVTVLERFKSKPESTAGE